jgi:hypothetical protein
MWLKPIQSNCEKQEMIVSSHDKELSAIIDCPFSPKL